MFCRDPKLMGNLVNHRLTSWAGYVVAGVIIGLNVFLLYQTLFQRT
jgi:manganese transport protein